MYKGGNVSDKRKKRKDMKGRTPAIKRAMRGCEKRNFKLRKRNICILKESGKWRKEMI